MQGNADPFAPLVVPRSGSPRWPWSCPATAAAESFPDKASDYVSDHTGYFVGALLLAILLLLLVVSISQRRSKEKAKAAAAAGAPPRQPPPGRRRCRRPAGAGRRHRRPHWPRRHRLAPARPAAACPVSRRRQSRRQPRVPRTAAAGCARNSRPNAMRNGSSAARRSSAARTSAAQRAQAAGRPGAAAAAGVRPPAPGRAAAAAPGAQAEELLRDQVRRRQAEAGSRTGRAAPGGRSRRART